MDRIPILKMGDYLLITIQVDMHDRLAITLQEDLTDQIVKHRSHGVLIDISALEMVDSFIGRMLGSIASMARLLDAETVVVGMQPAVAITLVELGLSMTGVRTALDVEIKFATWAESILSPLSDEQIQRMLATEFGGMNEVLADLYAVPGEFIACLEWQRLPPSERIRAISELTSALYAIKGQAPDVQRLQRTLVRIKRPPG